MDTASRDMAQLAEKLVLFEENPLYWGDENMYSDAEGLSGPKNWDVPFYVWDWAEQNHQDKIKPQIARAIARSVTRSERSRPVPQKTSFWDRFFYGKTHSISVENTEPFSDESALLPSATWLKKFDAEATQALERGDLESYAGFLEGMWVLEPRSMGR